MAKIVQTEGRTSSLLECYAEVQPIFCKDTKKIETTIPFNSIFLFSTQRLSIRQPPNYLPTEATEPTEVSGARYSPTDCTDMYRLGGYGIPAIPTQPLNYLPTEFTEYRNDRWGISSHRLHRCSLRGCSSLCCTNKAIGHQHYNPPTDCTDVHRLGGYGIPAIPTQPQNYLPTEFTEYTETTGGEEKICVHLCNLWETLLRQKLLCIL